MTTITQPTTGRACSCRPGRERDNCPRCEGTGKEIDFQAIRAPKDAHECLPGDPEGNRVLPQAAGLPPAPIRGSYRPADGKAMIEWELEPKENGLEFSASGEFDGGAGQCIEEIARAYPDDAQVQRIARVWEKYHLNGMNAGTPEQSRALEEEREKAVAHALTLPNPGRFFYSLERREINPHTLDEIAGLEKNTGHYGWACHVLKNRDLYRVRIPSDTSLRMTGGFDRLPKSADPRGGWCYDYGHGWIFNPLPADVVAEVHSWSEFGRTDSKSLGDCKAEEFLAKHGIRMRISLSDSKPAPWEIAGHHYRVTLSAGVRSFDNSPRRLVFDFWGSAHDAETGEDPSIHSVLHCVASDIHTPETFEEFCSDYGDDQDSRKALQTFNRANRFARRLRSFFTAAEQEELAEIQ